MMKFWSNFAKYGEPGFSSNNVKWEPYRPNENNVSNYMILDNKKNLKMSSDNLTLTKLSQQVYSDSRLDEVEKCVVLYQMLTYVGEDLYMDKSKNYKGSCDRNASEQFLIDNASFIDY